MELKAPQQKNNKVIKLKKLESEAKLALKQIKKSNYTAELKTRGITKICAIGIAFSGKTIKVVTE